MSDALSGGMGQRGVDPTESMQRVDPMDRDSPDRERRQQEPFDKEGRRGHFHAQGEDRVEISEAALRALREASEAGALPP